MKLIMFFIVFLALPLVSESKLKGCNDEKNFLCVKCSEPYLLIEGLCLINCPSGYSKAQSSCEPDQKTLFKLNFYENKSYKDNRIGMFHTPF